MKRASTRFWLCGSLLPFACAVVCAQLPKRGASPSTGRVNELTLGGLRPGKDTIEKAKSLYSAGWPGMDPLPDPLIWEVAASGKSGLVRFEGNPRHLIQTIIARPNQKELDLSAISEIRIPLSGGSNPERAGSFSDPKPQTGKGLALTDSCAKAVRLYGEPDSRSPSTKNGQPLELLYYAFDWAGPDVPQVMEVVCTVEKEGKPGRVVEITLAAGNL